MRGWRIGLLFLVGIGNASWADGRMQELTLVGTLTRVVAVGAETTGWAVELESDMKIDRATVKRIEIDPGRENVERFEDKRVEVKGTLIWRSGVERRNYPVVEVRAIRELR